MIELKIASPMHQDCSAEYSVLLDKEYTIKEFVKEVLEKKEKEWGFITIKNHCSCEYSHGTLISSFPEEYMNKKIFRATCYINENNFE